MTGGGGFETGSDYVAAKVSVDVDASGIQTLREMSQEIDRLRTSTEAAARGSASFKSYLEQITQAAQQATEAHRNLSSMLERTADAGSRSGGGGGNSSQALPLSRSASGAYVDPWAGMGAGMGGSRAPSGTDIQAQIDPTKQLDPYKYVNAQAGRYNVRPGDVPSSGPMGPSDISAAADRIDSRDTQIRNQEASVNAPPGSSGGGGGGGGEGMASRAARYGNLAGNIMNEMSPGGSHGGMGRMLQHGLGAAAKHLGGGGSGAAPSGPGVAEDAAEKSTGGIGDMLGSGLGKAGIGMGVGMAGLAAFEKGGAMIQNYRNLGNIQGQGVSGGLKDEAAIRTMALNPFLSTEQSRQIIMAGLTEGYSGKTFDTITSMMAPQPLSSPVLTPTGWVKMGELAKGDLVVGADGAPKPILGVRDWGSLEVFELTFQDGTTARSSGEHRWLTHCTTRKSGPQFKTPRQMIESGLQFNSGRSMQPKYRVPLTQPVQFDEGPLPLDPYLLGLLLGDGSFSCSVAKGHIPTEFLFSSVESRIALLQGLIDTDGCIAKNGHTSFANTSPQLVEDVVFLVRSLGGMASVSWRTPKPGHVWGSKLPIAQVGISFPPGIVPARLPRKVERYRPGLSTPRRAAKAIVSIESVGYDSCRCISVSRDETEDGLYITESFTVTSNSNLKDMNVSVSDSVQMVRKNVKEGGQSLQGFAASMATIKSMAGAPGNGMSMPDMVAAYQQGTDSLVSSGQSGGTASEDMLDSLGVHSGQDDPLKGSFSQMVGVSGTTSTSAALIGAYGGTRTPGVAPQMQNFYNGQHGISNAQGTAASLTKMTKQLMGRYQAGTPQYTNGLMVWMKQFSLMFPGNPAGSDPNLANDWVQSVLKGGNPLAEGVAAHAKTTTQVNTVHGASPGEGLGAIWRTAVDGAKQIGAMVTGNDEAYDNAGADSANSWSNYGYHATASASNPVLDSVIAQNGARNIQVQGSDGNWGELTGSKDQVTSLTSGGAKWRKGNSGDGQTLAQTPASGGGLSGNTNVSFSPATVQITIDNQGKATANPSTAKLTPNQQQANAGYGSAGVNNPPPGNGYPNPIGTSGS